MEFITANFAPIMFAGLICFLLLGFPVAFSLGACGLTFGIIGIELGVCPSSVLACSIRPSRCRVAGVPLRRGPAGRLR